MARDISTINIAKRRIEEEKSKLSHTKFLNSLFTELSANFKLPAESNEFIKRKELSIAESKSFGSFCYVAEDFMRICPEPLSFINEFKDITNAEEAHKKFLDKVKSFQTVEGQRLNIKDSISEDYTNLLNDNIWFGSTLNGVNLRPGLLNNEEATPYAVPFCDRTVHGVVVGRTGSGKSVFLNSLIFNMLTEYAPWELDLYLADFKKVEFSRYMTGEKTPHVRACAATSEIRYVVSLITYLENCMQARNKLFSVLGLTNIRGFREKYKVVLPRIVLVVDEFQQLFLEATTRESNIINELVMSITKLGRAVGFHLLFASQEMSGALSGKALANFKIRFALPCESEISSAILGNSAAIDLKVGEVLVNTESGDSDKNQKYQVPYIGVDERINDETEKVEKESDFKLFLSALSAYARQTKFKKIGKYYNEDSSSEFAYLENDILNNEKFRIERKIVSSDIRYFDIITLGESVVYSDKTHDLETFFIERGKNRNIIAVSPSVSDLAYLTRLFATNFKRSAEEGIRNSKNHSFFALNAIADQMYDIGAEIDFDVIKYESADNLAMIERAYQFRGVIRKALDVSDSIQSYLKSFCSSYCKVLAPKASVDSLTAKAYSIVNEINQSESDVIEYCDELLNGNATLAVVKVIATAIKAFQLKDDGVKGGKIFEPYIVWISGLENIEKLPAWFNSTLKNSMDVNMLFIILSTSEDSARNVLTACEYVFVSGNNPKIYDRCGLNYTKKSSDSIAIDFKIRSANVERSFKKFKVEQNEFKAPSIDFDTILLERRSI